MGNWLSSAESKYPITIRAHPKYGWRPDTPDSRDIYIRLPSVYNEKNVDLRSELMPPVYNQGDISSSVANAVLSSWTYDTNKKNQKTNTLTEIEPSRLFVYLNQRIIDGTTELDVGGSIRDSLKVLNGVGVCREEQFPYNTTRDIKYPPTEQVFKKAGENKGIKYQKLIPLTGNIKSALSLGYPIVFGFSVYESFDQLDKYFTVPIPKPQEKVIATHCALICGFDNKYRKFLVRNSWGDEWGDGGYCWIPYKYISEGRCADFWIIERQVKNAEINYVNINPSEVEMKENEEYEFKDEDSDEDP